MRSTTYTLLRSFLLIHSDLRAHMCRSELADGRDVRAYVRLPANHRTNGRAATGEPRVRGSSSGRREHRHTAAVAGMGSPHGTGSC